MKMFLSFFIVFFFHVESYCQLQYFEQTISKQMASYEECESHIVTYNVRYPVVQNQENDSIARVLNDSITRIVLINIKGFDELSDSSNIIEVLDSCEFYLRFEEQYEIGYSISPVGRFQSVVIEKSYSWRPGNGQTSNFEIYCFNIIDTSFIVGFDEMFESNSDKHQVDSLVLKADSELIESSFENRDIIHFNVYSFSFSERNFVFYYNYYPYINREFWGKIKIPFDTVLNFKWDSKWMNCLISK